MIVSPNHITLNITIINTNTKITNILITPIRSLLKEVTLDTTEMLMKLFCCDYLLTYIIFCIENIMDCNVLLLSLLIVTSLVLRREEKSE